MNVIKFKEMSIILAKVTITCLITLANTQQTVMK